MLPGQRISPERLAAGLGVSHIPVREALRALEGEGQIVVLPRRGFFIPELSPADAEDIYRWRRVLESEAQRLGIPRLTAEDFDSMKQLNKVMDQAVRDSNPVAFAQANRTFHFIPFSRGNSRYVDRFLRHLWGAAERYYFTHLEPGTHMTLLQTQHRKLLKAFLQRNIELANEVMNEHRNVTLNVIRERFAEVGELERGVDLG
jgi:DNA-binding GntR family transcriptional regulator